ncbi:unnamed protein product [Cyprideis torosa]|uniref:Uncharacterized protein n=1 Tax=Cyprideis torosa TaxID=163714 RepID=A0A7R8W6T9_9CRUS|nr:unnamed protein product [Cyprideis torosa]CAG0886839.1 unnamed protein product [Cyprideis torosa]
METEEIIGSTSSTDLEEINVTWAATPKNRTTPSKILMFNRIPKCGSESMIEILQRLRLLHGLTFNIIRSKVNSRPYISDRDELSSISKHILSFGNTHTVFERHINFIDFERVPNHRRAVLQAKRNIEEHYAVVGILELMLPTLYVLSEYLPFYFRYGLRLQKKLDGGSGGVIAVGAPGGLRAPQAVGSEGRRRGSRVAQQDIWETQKKKREHSKRMFETATVYEAAVDDIYSERQTVSPCDCEMDSSILLRRRTLSLPPGKGGRSRDRLPRVRATDALSCLMGLGDCDRGEWGGTTR